MEFQTFYGLPASNAEDVTMLVDFVLLDSVWSNRTIDGSWSLRYWMNAGNVSTASWATEQKWAWLTGCWTWQGPRRTCHTTCKFTRCKSSRRQWHLLARLPSGPSWRLRQRPIVSCCTSGRTVTRPTLRCTFIPPVLSDFWTPWVKFFPFLFFFIAFTSWWLDWHLLFTTALLTKLCSALVHGFHAYALRLFAHSVDLSGMLLPFSTLAQQIFFY